MWTGAGLLSGIFLASTEEAYHLAVKGLPLLGLCALPFAINITFIGYYQSCEKAVRSIVYMLLRGVVFMIPGFILLPQLTGVSGLWLAIPQAELIAAVIIVSIYVFRDRKIRSVRQIG